MKKEFETSCGVLTYRDPTILEYQEIMRTCQKHLIENDNLGAIIEITKIIGPRLFDYSKMNGVSNFEELNKLGDELTSTVSEIAESIIVRAIGAISKKSLLRTE